jgi:hypothetical protein
MPRQPLHLYAAPALCKAALAPLSWKAYTPRVLDALGQAFTAGTRQGPFTLADYDAVRRHFAAAGVPTVPVIDLTATVPDDDDAHGPLA